METESPKSQKRLLLLALGLWCLLAIGIATSPSQWVYDEPYHIGLAKLVFKEGFFNALVSPANQSAAGPHYASLQLAFEWATSLAAPGIRWVGFFCLLLSSILVSKTTFASKERFLSISQVGICFLGIPFLWPCAGMALTEIPAMLFFSLALFCVAQMIGAENSNVHFSWAALAGLSLGLAILGRQTYLILIPVIFLWALFQRKFLLPVLLLFVFAGLCSGWLFIVWKGLVPPSQQMVDGGLRFDHALLAMVYIGVAGFALAPSLLKQIPLRFGMPFLIFSGAIGFFTIGVEVVPAKSLLISLFGMDLAGQIGRLALAAMFAISVLWIISLSKKIILERNSFLFLNLLILLAFISVPAKISHLFSSRYVVTAMIPLIFLTGFENTKLAISLKVLGGLVGAATLATYYGWI
jgi:hypothetical protein